VIIASLAAGAVGFLKVKEVIVTTQTERDTEQKAKNDKIAELAKTNKTLKDTSDKLKTTETTLAKTASDLQTVTAKADDLDKQKTELMALLEKTKGERDTAQQTLAQWDIITLKPDQVKGMIAELTKTKEERDAFVAENKILIKKKNELQARLDVIFNPIDAPPPQLPLTLKGKVLAVDEKFQFVVLDIGTDQGALARGELIVSRNGNMIAKVSIATLEQNRCIANILPGWQKANLLEGDAVIAALVN
jgi:hypothetical protein